MLYLLFYILMLTWLCLSFYSAQLHLQLNKLKSFQLLKTLLAHPSLLSNENPLFKTIQTPQAQPNPLPHKPISLPCSFFFNSSPKHSTNHPKLPPKLYPIFSMAFDQTPCAKPHSISNLHHPLQPPQNPSPCSSVHYTHRVPLS